MTYFLFTSLFLVSLGLAVRPFLTRRAAPWPSETPDARDDVSRAVSGLRDLEFARAAGTIAPEDHARLRALLERSAFTAGRTDRGRPPPRRALLIPAPPPGVGPAPGVGHPPPQAGRRAPREPNTRTP